MPLLILVLLGCPYIGTDAWNSVIDADDDTVTDGRFGGADCADGDGTIGDCDQDGDGARRPPFGEDCDDTNGAILPGTPERCDGLDNDCDGQIDELEDVAPGGLNTFYVDADADGYGAVMVQACDAPAGTVERDGDCDDSDASRYPGLQWATDDDGDGWGAGPAVETACQGPAGTGPIGDCDDTDASRNPDAIEVCGGLDDDCDGLVDDADVVPTPWIWRLDADGDGYARVGTEIAACTAPSGQHLQTELVDCADDDPLVTIDVTWYLDVDGDGFGVSSSTLTQCLPPAGHVRSAGDCDDEPGVGVGINPFAQELCNGIDDDCDGMVDEGYDPTVWFADVDGDGYGDSDVTEVACFRPPNHATLDADCDDMDSSRNPGEFEICDAVDNDCNGEVDDHVSPALQNLWFYDGDGDGVGVLEASQLACDPPANHVDVAGDCDDTDPTVLRAVSYVPDDATLEEAVATTCDGGTILLSGGPYTVSNLEIMDRILRITSEDDIHPVQLTPDSDAGSRMFGLRGSAVLLLEDVVITDDSAGTTTTPELIFVRPGTTLEMSGVQIESIELPQSLVKVRSSGTVIATDLEVSDVRVGAYQPSLTGNPTSAARGGLFEVDRFGTLEVSQSSFDNVQTSLGQPQHHAVIASGDSPRRIMFDDVTLTNSANDAGTALFTFVQRQSSAFASQLLLQDVQVVQGGRVLITDGLEVAVVRNRWEKPASHHVAVRANSSCMFGSHAVPAFDYDAVTVLGTGRISIDNSEIYGSGSICLATDKSQADVEASVFANLPRGLFAGGHAVHGCQGTGIQVEATNNVFYDTVVTPGGVLHAHANFSKNAIDAPNLPERRTAVAACVGFVAANPVSVADLTFVSPRTLDPATPVVLPSDTSLLFPYIDDFNDVPPQSIGLLAGTQPDDAWMEDDDRDLTSDGWELFWFDSLDCATAQSAYDAGVMPSVCGLP